MPKARAATRVNTSPDPILIVEESQYWLQFTESEATELMVGEVSVRIKLAVREMIGWSLEAPHKFREAKP